MFGSSVPMIMGNDGNAVHCRGFESNRSFCKVLVVVCVIGNIDCLIGDIGFRTLLQSAMIVVFKTGV